jgi:N-acetyl-anhydromuramyl-L-alanine amidase AmpD
MESLANLRFRGLGRTGVFIRRLAVFSLVMVVGTLDACRPSASIVRPAPEPPAVVFPTPIPVVPPANVVPEIPTVPTQRLEPVPVPTPSLDNPWQPTAAAREWTSIVIHHTATDKGSVESIHETHIAKEWLGIGYHFVIGNGNGMGDGEIEPTFRWREQLHGAHAGSEEYNQHGIGIALVGNFDEQPPSPAQLAAIKRLVAVLKSEYHIDSEHIIGHSEVKATACPGKLFPLSEVQVAEIPRVPQAKSVRELKGSIALMGPSGSRLP